MVSSGVTCCLQCTRGQGRCSPAQNASERSSALLRPSPSLDSKTRPCRSPPSGCTSCASWLFLPYPRFFCTFQRSSRLMLHLFFLWSSLPDRSSFLSRLLAPSAICARTCSLHPQLILLILLCPSFHVTSRLLAGVLRIRLPCARVPRRCLPSPASSVTTRSHTKYGDAGVLYRPKWLVYDCLDDQPRGQERINHQLNVLSVSNVDLSTQSKDTSIVMIPGYGQHRLVEPDQPNTASCGIRPRHRIPQTLFLKPIPQHHTRAHLT